LSSNRILKAKGAHDTLIDTAHQLLGDALEIESAAKIRLADEYDAEQERGELAKRGQKRADVVAATSHLTSASDAMRSMRLAPRR